MAHCGMSDGSLSVELHLWSIVVLCVSGSCPSYWSEEAGPCVQVHYREHSRGKDRGKSRNET